MSTKTPDEIKKGLWCCTELDDCKGCPYIGDGCNTHLKKDLAEYIRQLEAERDAAVADLRRGFSCFACKNWKRPEKAAECFQCQYGRIRRFEWRGVQKEDTNA